MSQPSSSRAHWWRDAVIYQIYIRSFADSNADGVGDLNGISSRLPYLCELGVDAVWITPFYPSPMADGGYDVADYRDVDPMFGSLADAKALIEEMHSVGLRMIVDIVPNHTSDRHEWFQAALASEPGSAERLRYIIKPGRGASGELPPTDWVSVFGGPAWTRLPDGEWYLHLFAPQQPDLNWEHPEVHAEFLSILRFWLDLGVDGFRIDVAHGLMKDPAFPDLGSSSKPMIGTPRTSQVHWDRDAVHDVYREWRKVLDSYAVADGSAGDRIGVAEAWVRPLERMARYVRPDELHQSFNFDYLRAPWSAAELRQVIDDSLAATTAVGATTTWVLSNHDVIRHVSRFGDGEMGQRRARAALLLTLALPGSTYLYQGEELGLPEVIDLPEDALQDPTWERSGHTIRGRDGCRVPLPWTTSGSSYGFGADGSWLPQPASWAVLSVQAQHETPGSMLDFYRSALVIRREHPALGEGTLSWLVVPVDALAFERRGATGKPLVCVVNLGAYPLTLPAYDEVLLSSGPLDPEGRLPRDAAAWLS